MKSKLVADHMPNLIALAKLDPEIQVFAEHTAAVKCRRLTLNGTTKANELAVITIKLQRQKTRKAQLDFVLVIQQNHKNSNCKIKYGFIVQVRR